MEPAVQEENRPRPRPREAGAWSGRRVVAFGVPLALIAAGLVLWAFMRFGEDTFKRSARAVEARGRAYELAMSLARCMNRENRSELPPSAGPVPASPPVGLFLDERASREAFSADAFTCADFHPAGELHVQIEWRRETPVRGVVVASLADKGDGHVNFEADSVLTCDAAPPERCRAAMVTEKKPDARTDTRR